MLLPLFPSYYGQAILINAAVGDDGAPAPGIRSASTVRLPTVWMDRSANCFSKRLESSLSGIDIIVCGLVIEPCTVIAVEDGCFMMSLFVNR
jgi:hypothetical protein